MTRDASSFDVGGNEEAYRLAATKPDESGSGTDPDEAKQRRKLERAVKRDDADTGRRIA